MNVDLEAMPDWICKKKGARLMTYTWTFMVYGLLKFFFDPNSAISDLVMAMILWCAITAGNYLMLAVFQVIFLTHMIAVISLACGFGQTGFSKISGLETRVKLIFAVHILTVIVHLIGKLC